eukprot:CAMPEP_0113481830 /NCGR_PEP_ID=MMETSP0014_2-20120614/22608_1 /TAXON_ID=2857 /ORGANISM="Nitzschia sp." /LENGTH=360 /DNA_ID=CAMNT_0000375333 /DNA_START=237 /DNA_END=1319 /DNA_ORIENTATION=- /assembly_acc=CAM_ASM_000159
MSTSSDAAAPTEASEDTKMSPAPPAVVAHEEDGGEEETAATSAVDGAIAKAATSTDSYWDAPAEKALDGKTLSTMDMTMLGHQNAAEAGAEQGEASNTAATPTTANIVRPPSSNSFWDWQEGVKKSLSNMSLSNLKRGSHQEHVEQKQEEEEEEAQEQQKNKTTSMSAGSGGGGYWFWKNASSTNLSSNVSLTTLEKDVKSKEEGGGTIRRNDSATSTGSGSKYWFWKNPSMSKMSFSNASLTALDKSAKEQDELDTSTGSNRSIGSSGSGPITNLQHKLRNSWRASFKQLSSNSLTGMDELGNSSGKGAAAAKKEYAERRISMSGRSASGLGLGNITCEEAEEEEDDDAISCGSGAITF